MQGMEERFSDNARHAMELAYQASQRFNHEYIGTEHLLLGVTEEPSGIAANVLKNMGIDPHKIQSAVERLVQSGPSLISIGTRPQTPRVRHVVELAVEEAQDLQRPIVDTGDLLIALLREINAVAAQVLMNQGLQLQPLRDEIAKSRTGQSEVDSSGRGFMGRIQSLWAYGTL
jgi:ATP-dependent Clp protease ATP-binding subunit ClpC